MLRAVRVPGVREVRVPGGLRPGSGRGAKLLRARDRGALPQERARGDGRRGPLRAADGVERVHGLAVHRGRHRDALLVRAVPEAGGDGGRRAREQGDTAQAAGRGVEARARRAVRRREVQAGAAAERHRHGADDQGGCGGDQPVRGHPERDHAQGSRVREAATGRRRRGRQRQEAALRGGRSSGRGRHRAGLGAAGEDAVAGSAASAPGPAGGFTRVQLEVLLAQPG
mmetsp:Transcript_8213/g.28834  ORF Transcript_8213/g.28834 Transcript_8213/m.28834 type:complete len:227 (+) Transcript_8213:712-1392(+)